MTYYYLFIILFMGLAYLVEAIREKRYVHWLKATAACIVGGLLGVLVNLSNLYHTWQYGQESMRGKSELVKADTGNQTNSGLERDYITQWSYGIGETWTLLVPNTKGGASQPLAANKTAMAHADNNYIGIYQQLGQYWGEQPGTQGPVYVGAFVLFLFVLGLFIVKGPMKWALFAATVLSILLSWGKNFMGFTDFFLDYVPMYAKFRTVASILVIAEFTIPLLAMMALKTIIDEPEVLKKKIRYVYTAFGLTAGFCLLFDRRPEARVWKLLASTGRMACTNYLGQSVFGVLLFYGIGLGWGAGVDLLTTELIALGVYLIQMLFSRFWLNHFLYGPVEWVWRMITYRKRLPMLRDRG
jgi:hypothetical protein